MASSTYLQKYADGTSKLVRRSVKQGRKSMGLSRWTGRLTKSSLDALRKEAEKFSPYYTVNDFVRIAVDNYVRTELLKQ